MNELKKVLVTAGAVLAITIGVAGPLYATTCWLYADIDAWTLDPVEVTVDGDTTENMQAYDGLDVRLESRPDSTAVLIVTDADSGEEYRVGTDSEEIPERFQEHSSQQGGEQ